MESPYSLTGLLEGPETPQAVPAHAMRQAMADRARQEDRWCDDGRKFGRRSADSGSRDQRRLARGRQAMGSTASAVLVSAFTQPDLVSRQGNFSA